MLKKIFLPLCLTLCFNYTAQNSKALDYYNAGAVQFNAQNYRQADSLFTLSYKLVLSTEALFIRALCREKMANKKGSCSDLATASSLGESKATQLFIRTCGKIDTAFIPVVQNFSTAHILSRKISYTFNDSILLVSLKKYHGQERVRKEVERIDTVAKQKPNSTVPAEQSAEFPGGMPALMNYIQNNIRIPRYPGSEDISSKVFVKFIIENDGSINDINVVKDIPGCKKCSEEATRLVAGMPTWKPAQQNGIPVKMYFNLPISFRSSH